jgi:uncharacterized protein
VLEVEIQADVHTTEDPDKVVQSVRQIFPDAEVEFTDGEVRARSGSLDTLLRKAREERVLDAARGTLWRGRLDEGSTRFEVNKQAAYVGRLNFNEVTHPLGDLVVTVQTDDLNALLDKIAPPTRAELNVDKTSEFRARLHQEEDELARMGTSVETGFDDEPEQPDLDPWTQDDEDDEDQDEDLAAAGDEKDKEEDKEAR